MVEPTAEASKQTRQISQISGIFLNLWRLSSCENSKVHVTCEPVILKIRFMTFFQKNLFRWNLKSGPYPTCSQGFRWFWQQKPLQNWEILAPGTRSQLRKRGQKLEWDPTAQYVVVTLHVSQWSWKSGLWQASLQKQIFLEKMTFTWRVFSSFFFRTLGTFIKGEIHTKMKNSHLVVFGALSRMVKIRGACDELFWVY